MSAIADRLSQDGKRILRTVDAAYAQARVLETKWDAQTAEKARHNLCAMLRTLHNDERLWRDLASPVKRVLDPQTVERVMRMDLDEFEEFEIRTFRSAGLHEELARKWARDAAQLLFVVQLGFDRELPPHLQPNIAKMKA